VRSLALIVGACVIAALATACGGGDPNATGARTTVPATDTHEEPDPNRAPGPAVTGESLDGEPIALSDFKGHPVLVNVWSSW
jgi:hypothetical protein